MRITGGGTRGAGGDDSRRLLTAIAADANAARIINTGSTGTPEDRLLTPTAQKDQWRNRRRHKHPSNPITRHPTTLATPPHPCPATTHATAISRPRG